MALTDTIVDEILAGYNANPEHFVKYRDIPERPVRFYVQSDSLKELDASTSDFDRLVKRRLQQVYSVEAYPVVINDAYTGAVQVRAYVEGYND